MTNNAILLNPSAGRGRALREKDRLEAILRQNNIDYNIFVSRSSEHLTRLAADKSKIYETIVGVGGDGTFNIIINELMRQGNRNTFGMVSLGNQNDIAREFGVDNLEKACFAIKRRQTREVDLGVLTADDSEPLYFLGTASLGLGVTVNRYVKDSIRRYPTITRFGFIKPVFGILGIYDAFSAKEVPISMSLKYDNSSVEDNFSLVVFNNISFYAGGKKLSLDATPYDGLLDCCCVTAESLSKFLEIYRLYRKGKHTLEKDVKLIKASEFKIISELGVEIQADGEVRGPYKQITLYVQPRALRLIVHPNYVEAKK